MYVDQPGRKHPFLRRTLLSLLGVLVAFAVICCFFGQPKDHTDSRTRRSGVSTILLCGTDEEGYRTDTMILMTLDSREHTVSLLSLPRDTYTSGYSVPKLNSACGAAGGGEAGMENLMNEVTVLLGFRPDRYAMVNFDVVEKVVDLFGGVTFNVPMDMDYEDPYQNLYIHLKAGEQKLDGEESVQLLRFRSGYAMADLERVNVQRAFVQAAMEQWVNPLLIFRGPAALAAVRNDTTTDLSVGNLIWIARAMIGCDFADITTNTLPGQPQMINGGSYFVADQTATAQMMQEIYSPYID